MNPKDTMYMILGGFTILGNLVAVVYAFSWMRFQLKELAEGQKKIMDILYPEEGKLQFQTVESCAANRKGCRGEVCDFVKTELRDQKESIKRIHARIDELTVLCVGDRK